MPQVVLFNKPFGVLSQFTPAQGHPGLKDYLPVTGFYPAGRLDHDSEGLLLLTDDGRLQARISQPRHKMKKTYWVQLEGVITDEAIAMLCRGIDLNDGLTLPAKASRIPEPAVWPRTPPIRRRENIPTCWLELTLSEGRNRQVRRMTAAVGFPTLRLIRCRIGPWSVDGLKPGEYRTESVHLPAEDKPATKPASKKRRHAR